MRPYLSLFKIKFINNIQYRMAAIAGILTQFFFGIVFIMVYLAFYRSGNNSNLPMNWNELVSYLWLNQIFFALVYIWQKDREFLNMIKDGNIAYELCRPINFYKKWFATMYGNRIAAVLLRFLPVTIIAILLPYPYKLLPPISIMSFILFIIALILSSLMVTAIMILFHIITIFTIDERGIMTLLMVLGEILAGGTIPISFFPGFLQKIAYILPFRYIADLPFRIYSGNITISNAIPDLIGGLIWLITLLLFGYILSLKATRKAVIQGG